jgi:hypothetical protein
MKKLEDILKGKTCAVVSNSGSLLENEYGSLIDSHDVILRVNRCIIKGFETYVGSKTDIRLLNIHCSNSIFDNSYQKDYFNKRYSTWSTNNITSVIEDEILILRYSPHVSMVNKIIDNEIYSKEKFIAHVCLNGNLELTAGGDAILIATSLFEKVSCFCFDLFSNISEKEVKTSSNFSLPARVPSKKIHYFEDVFWNRSLAHNYKEEKKYLKKISNIEWFD